MLLEAVFRLGRKP